MSFKLIMSMRMTTKTKILTNNPLMAMTLNVVFAMYPSMFAFYETTVTQFIKSI